MTEQELAKVMHLLEKHYRNFYQGSDKKEVFAAWYPFFKGDDPRAVEKAVVEVICNSTYPPVVADIKRQMAEDEEEDKPTALEAFQMISDAVDDASNRTEAAKAFNALPPILRKLVRKPAMLMQWHQVSDEAFNTVVMSAIRESYKELSKRETKFHTLPIGIRQTSGWMIEGADPIALPEGKQNRTPDDIISEMDQKEKEYREQTGIVRNDSYGSKIEEFLKPVTDAEIKALEYREQQKIERLKNDK